MRKSCPAEMFDCGCGQNESEAVAWLYMAVAAIVCRLIMRGGKNEMKDGEGGSMSESTVKKSGGKILVVAILIAAVIGVIAIKNQGKQDSAENVTANPAAGTVTDIPGGGSDTAAPAATEKLPKLVDLGAGKCIPCKMMAPILEELKKEYIGRMNVVFIDVWENKEAGEQYGIRMIPTQIFYDADGKELFRHEGFFSKEDILGKWKELGVNLDEKAKEAISETETTSPIPVIPENSGCGT